MSTQDKAPHPGTTIEAAPTGAVPRRSIAAEIQESQRKADEAIKGSGTVCKEIQTAAASLDRALQCGDIDLLNFQHRRHGIAGFFRIGICAAEGERVSVDTMESDR